MAHSLNEYDILRYGFLDKVKSKGGDTLSNISSKIEISGTKELIVKNACKVNYEKSITAIDKLGPIAPDSFCLTLVALKDA